MRISTLSPLRHSAIFGLTVLLLASPVAADRNADAIDALRALSSNPAAPVAPVLSEFEFNEALFLLDGLSRHELTRLRTAIDDRAVNLPSNIEGAIVGKVTRSGISRNNP